MRKKARILEDITDATRTDWHVDTGLGIKNCATIEYDCPSLCPGEARNGVNEARLACARRPEECSDPRPLDAEICLEQKRAASHAEVDADAHGGDVLRERFASARNSSASPIEIADRRAASTSPPGDCRAL